ncbi:MAG: AAA family ATPase [Pseudomonadota bacterium]
MAAATESVQLASYVPPPVVRAIVDGALGSLDTTRESAVMIIDVAGFSSLADELSAKPAGAEQLSSVLNAYLGAVIDGVHRQGGDVIDFSGDAVIAAWEVDSGGTLGEALAHAAFCGLSIRDELSNFDAGDGHRISLKVSLGAGTLWSSVVEGGEDRSFYLLAGPELIDVGDALSVARSSEVLLTASATQLLAERAETTRLRRGVSRLERCSPPGSVTPRPVVRLDAAGDREAARFMAPPVRQTVSAGRGRWLAELRYLTVGFVNIGDLDGTSQEAKATIKSAVQDIADVVGRSAGEIVQLVADDKGIIAVCAWGMQGMSQEDDANRALLALNELSASLTERGIRAKAGVASGRLFCGDRGGAERREYALVGSAMNRAARLMQNADDRVFCDQATQDLISEGEASQLVLESVGPLTLKGFAEPISAYAARPARQAGTVDRATFVVGRKTETARLQQELARFAQGGQGARAIVVEGDAGIGKSTLLRNAAVAAQEMGMDVAISAATSIDQTVAYGVWRGVFSSLFGDGEAANTHSGAKATLLKLGLEDRLDLIPLLNPVFGMQLAETTMTEQLRGDARTALAHGLYLELLKRSAGEQGRVILLENASHFDSASWTLIHELARVAPNHLLLISSRTGEEAADETIEESLTIELSALDAPATRQVTACALDCEEIEDRVFRFVWERAGGNPLYAEQFAIALLQGGYLRIGAGVAHLDDDSASRLHKLPHRVERLTVGRIDRLAPDLQLALKVASVVQHAITPELLAGIYPVETARGEIDRCLVSLLDQGLLKKREVRQRDVYELASTIVRDAAYGMLLFEQRRDLHRAAGAWFEAEHAEDPATVNALLAYHYTEGEVPGKAIVNSDLAGQQALVSSANKEALTFLRSAADMARHNNFEHDGPPAALRNDGIAEALYRLGYMVQAERAIRAGLAHLGQRVPNPWIGLATQAFAALRHYSWRRGDGEEPSDATREQLELAYRMYERLVRSAYLDMDTPTMAYGTLRCLLTAERLGPSPELATAYSVMSGVMGLLSLHRPARSFADKCQDTIASIDAGGTLTEARGIQLIAVYFCGVGDWDAADQLMDRALVQFETYGEETEVGNVLQMQARNAFNRGDLDQLERVNERIMLEAERREAQQEIAWGNNNDVERLLSVHLDATEALRLGERNLERLQAGTHLPGNLAQCEALIAAASLRVLGPIAGLESAERALNTLVAGSNTTYGIASAYSYVCSVLLSCAYHPELPTERREAARKLVPAALKRHRSFAGVYPIATARSLLFRGRAYWLAGRTGKAKRAWQEAAAQAERLGVTYDLGLIRRELYVHGVDSGQRHDGHKEAGSRLLLEAGVDPVKVEAMFVDLALD